MIQRDYVASKARKKKKLTSVNKFMIIAITAFLLLGFGGGLFFLKKSTIEKGLVEKQERNGSEIREPMLPTRQEEGWNYIRSLETREVPTYNDPKKLEQIQNLTPEQQKILQQLEQESLKLEQAEKNQTSEGIIIGENVANDNNIATQNQFGVQCGAFRTLPQAESVQAKLLMSGFNAQVRQGTNLYRVIIGPMTTQAQANKITKEAKKIIECIIIKW